MSLIVDNLTKAYGKKVVVDHVSFTMDKPGVYALLGTNGAGKTTTIRMILGMLAKDEGTVTWNGAPLTFDTCNIGYLAEERGLYPKYSLMDQLRYFAALRGVSRTDADERIRRLSKRLELDEYLFPENKKIDAAASRKGLFASRGKQEKPKLADQLSKGNQQKIQLMASLLSDPELIVLDEPLSGLDPVNADLFSSVIKEEVNRGKYLIMSSHQMETIEEFCTDLTMLTRSKVVLQGNLNEIKKSYGRTRLHLKTDCDIAKYIKEANLEVLYEKENEYQLKVSGEMEANKLLGALITDGIPVVTFDLREPSLHEIFVEKAGAADDGK